MKSRRKHFLRLGVFSVVLAVFYAVYLQVGLFPGRLLDKAMTKIGEVTRKKVLCDKILFLPFEGLTFNNLRIFEKNNALIFSARRVSINVRILPFFQEKKIIIDHLLLEEPVYDLVLENKQTPHAPAPKTVLSGQIDVPVAGSHPSLDLEDLSNGPDFFLPENVYLEQINIRNGHLYVSKNEGEPVTEEIHSINVRMGFQQPPFLKFDGQVKLGAESYAVIDLNGQWDLQKDRYDFRLVTLSKKVPDWLLDYQKKHFLILEEGQFSLKTHLVGGGGSKVLFRSEAHLNNANIQVSTARFAGRMHLKAQGVFDSVLKKFSPYKGVLELVSVDADHITPSIPRLEQLNGLVAFEPDLLSVRSLRGFYKKFNFEASGTVRSFKDLLIQGKILSELDISALRTLLPKEQSAKLKDFKIEGRCQAITLLTGSLKPPAKIDTEYKLAFQNASVKNEARHIDWSGLSGELSVDKRGLEIHSTGSNAASSPYALDAYIPKQKDLPGWVDLRTRGLRIHTDYFLEGENAHLSNARAVLPGVTASFTGQLLHWSQPELALQGEAEMQLDKFSEYLTQNKILSLSDLGLSGTLRGPFVLNGPWNKPLDWEFKMDAESPLILAKKTFQLEQFQLQLRMKGRRINIPYLRAQFYGGSIGSRLLFDLTRSPMFFDSRTYANNIDLSKLGPRLNPPNKEISGTLIGQVVARGDWQKPETYRGQGALSITGGNLWQTSQFKAMGKLPLVKVEGLDVVTFHRLNATFGMNAKGFHTEDMSLLSDTVDLSLRGSVGFDGALDLLMNIHYSDAVYQGAADTGGIAPLMVQQAGNFISQYQVSGSLKKPQYDKLLLPLSRS